MLSDENDIFDVNKISEDFHVSSRTINDDVKLLNNYLSSGCKNKNIISIKNNIINVKNKYCIKSFIVNLNFYRYSLNLEERLVIESLILLLTDTYITIQEMADIMMVSRSTVISDQNKLRKYVRGNKLKYTSKSGKGLRIIGDIKKQRLLFIKILEEYYYLINIFLNSAFEKDSKERTEIESARKTIFNIIGEIEFRHKVNFIGRSYLKLTTYLIYLCLFAKGDDQDTVSYETEDRNYGIEKSLYFSLCEYYNIKFDPREIDYLKYLTSKLQHKIVSVKNEDVIEVQFITRKLIDLISKELSRPLYLDYKLFESLSYHMERMRNQTGGDLIDYPEIRSIIRENKELFATVKKSSDFLESYFKREISDVEISYIVIYIYAALERLKERITKELKVLVVCNSGIGTSQLLVAKLNELFRFNILESTTSHQLNNIDLDNIDLIITTVDLYGITENYLKVSPLINDGDYKNIYEYISDMTDDYISEIQISNVESERSSIRDNITDNNFNNDKGLECFLTGENIILDIKAGDWRESIRMTSKHLLEKGYINEDYIEEMIANIETYGPYVVIGDGFALPHGDISKNVRKTSLCLARLENPINFGSAEYDPIKFVCVLAVDENKDHLKALFHLINLLKIDEFKTGIELASTSEEIRELIIKYN